MKISQYIFFSLFLLIGSAHICASRESNEHWKDMHRAIMLGDLQAVEKLARDGHSKAAHTSARSISGRRHLSPMELIFSNYSAAGVAKKEKMLIAINRCNPNCDQAAPPEFKFFPDGAAEYTPEEKERLLGAFNQGKNLVRIVGVVHEVAFPSVDKYLSECVVSYLPGDELNEAKKDKTNSGWCVIA